MTATTELVVPRSIPMILEAIFYSSYAPEMADLAWLGLSSRGRATGGPEIWVKMADEGERG